MDSDDQTVRGDIAIVGMAGTFAKAPDLSTFWRNIISGVDGVVDCPDDRWDTALYFDPSGERDDRVYCKRGGYITHPLPFEPASHGIMPVAVDGGEAEQFLLFGLVKQALASAGWDETSLPKHRTETVVARGNYLTSGLTGLFLRAQGVEDTLRVLRRLHPEYSAEKLDEIRAELRAGLPKYNAETALSLIPNVMSGRVANRLDLMGSNYTIDAACASSLIATDTVVRDLLTGTCDLGIVGAAHTFSNITFLTMFCTFKALSPRGVCRPFDKDADGTVPGDGVGVILLKRLSDAERAGDRIFAVIKGVGVASDGKALSLVAPRPEGEALALERAYQRSGVPRESIELIEGHGTGTLLGDETEIETLKRFFGAPKGEVASIAVGSVKSMIGHCMQASGMAGIIKTALALHHKIVPPTLNCDAPNPKYALAGSRLYVNTEARPWFRTDPTIPRRAGVNAFGFGGINAHLVLEEYVPRPGGAPAPAPIDEASWESELCLFRATNRAALVARLRQTREWLQALAPTAPVSLADVAGTLAGEPDAPCVLGVVAQSIADLRSKLDRAVTALTEPGCTRLRDPSGIYWAAEPLATRGAIAAVFPGTDSPYPNMLRELCLHFPEVRTVFEAEAARDGALGRPDVITDFIFPAPCFTQNQATKAQMRLLEPARLTRSLLTASRAIARLFGDLGVRPAMTLGRGIGEWAALEAAGAADLEPSGESFQGADVLCEELALSELVAAIHTPLCEPLSPTVRQLFTSLPLSSPTIPCYAAASATPFSSDAQVLRKQLADACVKPVDFEGSIQAMYQAGARIFIEMGPRGDLTALVDDILGTEPHLAIAADLRSRGGVDQLNHCLAQLAAEGVAIRPALLFSHRRPRSIDLFTPVVPMRPRAGAVELSLRNPRLDLCERFSEQLRTQPTTPQPQREIAAPAPDAAPESQDEPQVDTNMSVMDGYFQLMQQFLAVQRDVMATYLAGGHPQSGAVDSLSANLAPDAPPVPPPTRAPVVDVPAAPPAPVARMEVRPLSGTAAVTTALLALVSEKTGYPTDMLGLDLNLEAELGIDSIKRLEIMATFQKKHMDGGALPEGLPSLKTLRDVIDFFQGATEPRPASVARQ
jgi:acyl transferase domain-containing protein